MHLCIATTGASLATVQAAPRYGQTQTVRLTCKSSQLSGTKVPAQRYIAHARTASARRRATTMGLPIPIVGKFQQVAPLQPASSGIQVLSLVAGPLFNPFFAFIAYALGAAR